MKVTVKDQSIRENSVLVDMIKKFVPFTHDKLKYNKPFCIKLVSDGDNAVDSLGKTGFYNPEDSSISLYVDGRHDKDIMRSLSHEIIHHYQNCNGMFDNAQPEDEEYAQNNQELRELEGEAYLYGSGLLFRDFEDSQKQIRNKKMKKKYTKEQLREAIVQAISRVCGESPEEDKAETLNESQAIEKGERLFDILKQKWCK